MGPLNAPRVDATAPVFRCSNVVVQLDKRPLAAVWHFKIVAKNIHRTRTLTSQHPHPHPHPLPHPLRLASGFICWR